MKKGFESKVVPLLKGRDNTATVDAMLDRSSEGLSDYLMQRAESLIRSMQQGDKIDPFAIAKLQVEAQLYTNVIKHRNSEDGAEYFSTQGITEKIQKLVEQAREIHDAEN